MKYMGSKNRHSKELLPIILKDRLPCQWYVEPFVGGANMIDKVCGNRIGSDINPYLSELYKKLQTGWIPPHITEEDYNDIRINKIKYPPEMVAFAGFACSYGGKWFGGWCRGKAANGSERDYVEEAIRNLVKQSPKLIGVRFVSASYDSLIIPDASIIYCDPPYASTCKYGVGEFNSESFWKWCKIKVSEGHKVYVSEYSSPYGWDCVWSKEVFNTLSKDTGSKKGVEKLFTMCKDCCTPTGREI